MHLSNLVPNNGLIPRDVTGVSELTDQTSADGNDVTVAILDTGVDPAAAGLQTTTSGHRKIVDLVDCTCSGDVITTERANLSANSTLAGLSGRTLHVPSTIASLNPSKVFRLGLKHAFEFFPASLTRRLRRERRDVWERTHRPLVAEARLAVDRVKHVNATPAAVDEVEARLSTLLAAEKHYRDIGPVFDCIVFHDGQNWRAMVDTSQRGLLEQCDLLEDFVLKGSYSHFPDGVFLNFAINVYDRGDLLSIVVDCGSHGTHVAGIVAAHFPDSPNLDGLAPGARIVSLKIGDSRLSSMETHQGLMRAVAYCLARSPLQNVSTTSEHRDITASTIFNSIVTDHSSTSSNVIDKGGDRPPSNEQPSQRGNVPSTDTPARSEIASTSISRPRVCIDIINMSFGEHSRDVDNGRFVELTNRLVRKHNVIFVSSAGNDGPGLSSASAPGGTTSSIIGVGAYITSDMLTQAYSYLDSEYGSSAMVESTKDSKQARLSKNTCPTEFGKSMQRDTSDGADVVIGMPYTWSARGPVSNGSLGVCICAPGGAIAPIPMWNLRKKQLMNGTSMSSPSAAGAIATMLSYLKMKGIPYTSALIRRAIENTAQRFKLLHSVARLQNFSKNEVGTIVDHHESTNPVDLVFATGHGSISAFQACKYVESYMSLRKQPRIVPNKRTVKTELQTGMDVASVSTELTTIKSENGPLSKLNAENTSLVKDCGDSSCFLEDWHIQILVEDGSLAPRKVAGSCGFGGVNASRGIYLRSLADTERVRRAFVMAELVGYDEECVATKKVLADMEIQLSLECSASWVEVPRSLVFLGGGRSFMVAVDPTRLEAGKVHFTEVLAYVNHPGGEGKRSGPVFRVPVSVVKPERLLHGAMISPLSNLPFAPGTTLRRFYEAPQGATYAVMRITTGDSFSCNTGCTTDSNVQVPEKSREESHEPNFEKAVSEQIRVNDPTYAATTLDDSEKTDPVLIGEPKMDCPIQSKTGNVRIFDIHVVQVVPQKHCGEMQWHQSMSLSPGVIREGIIRLEGGCTLELCIAQLWSSPGQSCIGKVEIFFGGVVPKPVAVHCPPGAVCFPRVQATSLFSSNVIAGNSLVQNISGYSPRGFLTHLQRVVAPKTSNIRSLNERDVIVGEGKTFQLALQYAFEIFESSSGVKLLFPGLNRAVYESEIEGGPYVIVQDQENQFMFSSDIYPHERTLLKGEYVAMAYIRHDSIDALENLRQMRMTVQYALGSDINLDAFDSAHAACLGVDKRKVSRSVATLDPAERRAFFFGVPKRSALPKWANVGDLLEGTMTVDKFMSAVGGGPRRGSELPAYKISLSVGPSVPSSSSPSTSSSSSSSKGKAAEDATAKAGESSTTGGDIINKDAEKGGDKKNSREDNDKEDSGRVDNGNDQWMDDEIRKLKLKRLRGLMGDKKLASFQKLYHAARQSYGDDVELMMIKLESVDGEACRLFETDGAFSKLRELTLDAMSTSDSIVKKLDSTGIAAHFGCNIDSEDSEAVASRKAFDKKRQQLIETLFRNARVSSLFILYGENGFGSGLLKTGGQNQDGVAGVTKEDVDGFEKAMKELMKWTSLDGKGHLPGSSTQGLSFGSTSNEDLAFLASRREAKRGRFGAALRILDNFYGPGASKRVEAESVLRFREHVYTSLGWKLLVDRNLCYRLMRFPLHQMPF